MTTVAYIRVSTDRQDTDRQHTAIRAWSTNTQTPIDHYYEDKGRRHQADKREEFQRVIKDIQAGCVKRVVIDQQDRLGFQTVFEWFHWMYIFQQHGCTLIQAIDGKILSQTDPASFITTGIGAHSAREEMVKKSTRDLGKKREMALAGEWTGGWVSFGCDVLCKATDGTERWRVITDGRWRRYRLFPDGRAERWDGKGSFPRDRHPGDRLQLDRSIKQERLETLRIMFELYDQGWPFYRISQHLNQLGPTHWHIFGAWYAVLVKGVLRNPAAIGLPSYNKSAHGMYSELSNGTVKLDPPRHATSPLKAKTARRRATGDWVMPEEPLYEPIVEPALYWRVQERLNSPAPKRRGKSDALWLSGVLVCGTCSQPMVGWHQGKPSYCCSVYRRYGRANEHGCQLHRVRLEVIESFLERYLEDVGATLDSLVSAGESGLVAAIYRQIVQDCDRLQSLRLDMECYLAGALTEIIEPIPLPGGRSRFEVATPDRMITLDLPGCSDPTGLEEIYGWVSSAQLSRKSQQIQELEAEHARLFAQWQELDGLELARSRVREQLAQLEAELARLRPEGAGLANQIRHAWKALSDHRLRQERARRELAGSSLRARSEAVRGLLDRIVLWFDYRQHGQQLRSHLVRIDFEPLRGQGVSYGDLRI